MARKYDQESDQHHMARTRPEHEENLRSTSWTSPGHVLESDMLLQSPSGLLLELSGMLSEQARKIERMALLRQRGRVTQAFSPPITASNASTGSWTQSHSLSSSSEASMAGMWSGLRLITSILFEYIFPKI